MGAIQKTQYNNLSFYQKLIKDIPSKTLKRKIIHVDMDCFYAAVEEHDNPSLKGKPIAVGGSPSGRGVLCTANYQARKFGVRSAMSSAQALRLCPQLIFIKPRSKRYKEFSQMIREVFLEFTSKIEPLSLDEAYLDVTDCSKHYGSATLIAKEIKRLIKERSGLTASAGVAPNKFLAKIASDWKKPDGLFVIGPEEAMSFSLQLPLSKVPGIGPVSAKNLEAHGLKTLKDIQDKPLAWLEGRLGKTGLSLLRKSYGLDFKEVCQRGQTKSLSTEETYHQDLTSFAQIEERIPFLIEEVLERASHYYQKRPHSPEPIKFFIKTKTCEFKTHTHEVMLKNINLGLDPKILAQEGNRYFDDLLKHCMPLFRQTYEKSDCKPLRLLGVGFRLGVSPSYELERLGQLRLI